MHFCKLHWSFSALRKSLSAFFFHNLSLSYDFKQFIDLTKLALLTFLFSICSNFGLQILCFCSFEHLCCQILGPAACPLFEETDTWFEILQLASVEIHATTISTNPARSIQRGGHGVWGVGHWRGMRSVRLCGSGGMANATGGRADFDTWTCCFTAQVS